MSTEHTLRLRVRAIVRNDEMISARKALGMNQSQLAKMADVPMRVVGKFEKLDYTIRDAADKACKIAVALSIPIDKVLPEGMHGRSIPHTHTSLQEVQVKTMIASSQRDRLMLPSPEEIAIKAEEKALLITAIEYLSPREKKIISMHYGLGDGAPTTHEEIGKVLRITRTRVQQIEQKALRKLRNPALGIVSEEQEGLTGAQ